MGQIAVYFNRDGNKSLYVWCPAQGPVAKAPNINLAYTKQSGQEDLWILIIQATNMSYYSFCYANSIKILNPNSLRDNKKNLEEFF